MLLDLHDNEALIPVTKRRGFEIQRVDALAMIDSGLAVDGALSRHVVYIVCLLTLVLSMPKQDILALAIGLLRHC